MRLKIKTLERIYPKNISGGPENASLLLHLERYDFARKNIKGQMILDMACGSGYGTSILSKKDKKYVGVDNDDSAIRYARKNYSKENIEYRVANAYQFKSKSKFTTIVSLETIEHFDDPYKLIANMVKLLSVDGIIIASAPVTLSSDVNPYHKYDFTNQTFYALFQSFGFKPIKRFEQKQSFSPFHLVTKKAGRLSEMRQNLLKYYFQNPGVCFKRILTTLKYGFNNYYVTVVWKK